MMRPFLMVLPLFGFLALPAFGQNQVMNPNSFGTPKYELFVGYSYRGAKLSNPCTIIFSPWCTTPRPTWENAHGSALGFTYNFHKHIGVATELAAQHQSFRHLTLIAGQVVPGPDRYTVTSVQFLTGPRFFLRSGRVTQFAHVMAGAYRTFPYTGAGTDFAMGFGGGVNVDLTKRFSVRAFQADFIPVNQDYSWGRHLRLQTGVVFNFGC